MMAHPHASDVTTPKSIRKEHIFLEIGQRGVDKQANHGVSRNRRIGVAQADLKESSQLFPCLDETRVRRPLLTLLTVPTSPEAIVSGAVVVLARTVRQEPLTPGRVHDSYRGPSRQLPVPAGAVL